MKYKNDRKHVDAQRVQRMYFLDKVKTPLQTPENHKVHLKDPVGTNEGPWLVMDPVGGSSCVPRVPRYAF